MLESKGIYFKELYKETKKIFKHNQIISYLINNEKFNLIVSIRPSGNISKWLITKIKTYSEGTTKSPEFSSHKVCREIKGISNHLTFLMTVNEVYHRLKLISTIGFWMLIDIFNGFNKAFLRQAATAAQASNLIATKLRTYDFFLVKSSSTIEKEDSLNKSLTLNLSFYYETASNKYVYCIAWFFIKFLIFHSMQSNLNSISQTCSLNTAPVPTYNYPLWIILVQLFYLG